MALTKQDRRQRIRNRIRKIVSGTADSPRLSVYRSNKEIYAQLIDDVSGKTLCACSSREKEITTTEGSKKRYSLFSRKDISRKSCEVRC